MITQTVFPFANPQFELQNSNYYDKNYFDKNSINQSNPLDDESDYFLWAFLFMLLAIAFYVFFPRLKQWYLARVEANIEIDSKDQEKIKEKIEIVLEPESEE